MIGEFVRFDVSNLESLDSPPHVPPNPPTSPNNPLDFGHNNGFGNGHRIFSWNPKDGGASGTSNNQAYGT